MSMSQTYSTGPRMHVPRAEELPRTEFPGSGTLRDRRQHEWDLWRSDAERAVEPEGMARLLSGLDTAVAVVDVLAGRYSDDAVAWETFAGVRPGSAQSRDAGGTAGIFRGRSAVLAAHARNIRRLRCMVCMRMMEALR